MNGVVLRSGAPSGAEEGVAAERTPIRLALLNEHGLPADLLNGWLERQMPDFILVAIEEDWAALVRHPAFPSDVVILDADPVGPVSLAARVRAARATGSVVLLISSGELSSETASLPVVGTIMRGSSLDELDTITDSVRQAVRSSADRRHFAPAPRPRLSTAELRALRLYAEGATIAQVAQQMGVGYETVKTYLRRVRAKYARLSRPASRRAELVQRAAEDGILG